MYWYCAFFMNIFVSNLSSAVNLIQLRMLFTKFGTVGRLSLVRPNRDITPRFFYWISMKLKSDGLRAIKALNRSRFMRQTIVVAEADIFPKRIESVAPLAKRHQLTTLAQLARLAVGDILWMHPLTGSAWDGAIDGDSVDAYEIRSINQHNKMIELVMTTSSRIRFASPADVGRLFIKSNNLITDGDWWIQGDAQKLK